MACFTQVAGQATRAHRQARRIDRRPRRLLLTQPEQQCARTRGGGRVGRRRRHLRPGQRRRRDTGTSSSSTPRPVLSTQQFTASASKAVLTLVKAPTSNVIYIGGQFDFVNGVAREGVSGLGFTTGAVVGPPFAGLPAADHTVSTSAPTARSSTARWSTTPASTGARRTAPAPGRFRTQGNVQAVKYFSGTVYCGFHDAFQGDETAQAPGRRRRHRRSRPRLPAVDQLVLRRPVHRRHRWRGRDRWELHRGLRGDRSRASRSSGPDLYGTLLDRYWGRGVNRAMPSPGSQSRTLDPMRTPIARRLGSLLVAGRGRGLSL